MTSTRKCVIPMSIEPTMNSAWITWERQVRNRSMATALQIPLYELHSSRGRLLRYLELSWKTWRIVRKHKVSRLVVQNPSIALALLAVFIKRVLAITVLVDAHNAGIYPLEGKSRLLNLITRFICRNADIIIVTNAVLADQVSNWGGKPFIMTDPIPDFSPESDHKVTTGAKPFFLFVCTWAVDEPFTEVIKAASLVPEYDIYITGNYHKKLSADERAALPRNVRLLGFVSEEDYLAYCRAATGIIDLTLRDNCLVCGGYEAIALKKPGILSDSVVNREVFNKGFLFCENNSQSIANAMIQLVTMPQLKNEIALAGDEHRETQRNRTKSLKTLLD